MITVHISRHALPWVLLAIVLLGDLAAWLTGWLYDRYEVTTAPRRLRLSRRWYGRHSLVARQDGTFRVLRWTQEGGEAPWLHVIRAGERYAPSFWAPVTDFTPGQVRALRPRLAIRGRLRAPSLLGYRPLPDSRRHAGGTQPDLTRNPGKAA